MTSFPDETAHIARAAAALGDEFADRAIRWHLALLDAGISEAEAADIIADLTAPEIERIAA